MTRTYALSVLVILLVARLTPLAAAAQSNDRPKASSPNIVLIISDDQAWSDFSFMGHPHIQTPNLDRLSRESLTFTRGYVPSSLCCPSLASIITGLYPHQHKITSNDPIE
jgi:arylsulfatase A-like enzyme